tara:strand:+ start:14057 stop:14548 length:492 start_codon:yes stop_codon:yes gene_type:complete
MPKIKYIFTDFDGVLTDNKVYVSSNGEEAVVCNRSDGLAINAFKKVGIQTFIISTEKNNVVEERGKKLGIDAFYGIKNKKGFLKKFFIDNEISPEECLYIGNDINDIGAISLSKYSACPSDSHSNLKDKVTIILETKGGDGVLREIAEDFLNLDLIDLLGYNM